MATQEHPRLRPVPAVDAAPAGGQDAATCGQAEAARLFGVSARTVRRMVARGELATITDARGVRRVLASAIPTSRHEAADTSAPEAATAADTSALVAVAAALERAEERAQAAELQVRELEHRARAVAASAQLVLDGRWRARRHARRTLRELLDTR